MSDADHAADCVACTWACSTTGIDHGEGKVKTLALVHYRTCEHTDRVLHKQRHWDDDADEVVEEVVGQVNNDGMSVEAGREVTV